MDHLKRLFGSMCEYSNKCPFYNPKTCDTYYKDGWPCGIKREVDQGQSWEWIELHHHKKTAS